eukprot:gene31759-6957_t
MVLVDQLETFKKYIEDFLELFEAMMVFNLAKFKVRLKDDVGGPSIIAYNKGKIQANGINCGTEGQPLPVDHSMRSALPDTIRLLNLRHWVGTAGYAPARMPSRYKKEVQLQGDSAPAQVQVLGNADPAPAPPPPPLQHPAQVQLQGDADPVQAPPPLPAQPQAQVQLQGDADPDQAPLPPPGGAPSQVQDPPPVSSHPPPGGAPSQVQDPPPVPSHPPPGGAPSQVQDPPPVPSHPPPGWRSIPGARPSPSAFSSPPGWRHPRSKTLPQCLLIPRALVHPRGNILPLQLSFGTPSKCPTPMLHRTPPNPPSPGCPTCSCICALPTEWGQVPSRRQQGVKLAHTSAVEKGLARADTFAKCRRSFFTWMAGTPMAQLKQKDSIERRLLSSAGPAYCLDLLSSLGFLWF